MSFASTHYLSQTLKVTCDLIDEVDYFNGKILPGKRAAIRRSHYLICGKALVRYAQFNIHCSERSKFFLGAPAFNMQVSNAAVVENAAQDPQVPWCFTTVTSPE